MTPKLSIIVLTLDEEEHIGACLRSLAHQTQTDIEVIVVDAASQDRTVEIVEAAQAGFPAPLRLEAADERLPVGEARNRGVELAKAPHVAFLSADTEAHADWTKQALESLEDDDIVYGRQLHAPVDRTLAAAVRGLRYHFPQDDAETPERYASNANAALRREVVVAFPYGTSPEAGAVDDLILTERAKDAGYSVAYNPRMVVAHRDVTALDAELAKNLREAAGWGAHARTLGLNRPVLAWGGLLGLAVLLTVALPGALGLGLLAGALWGPAGRRVLRRRHEMRGRDLAMGFAASPVFDLAFLAQYLRYLILGRHRSSTDDDRTEEIQA